MPKLVRNNIPILIENDGRSCNYHIANFEELWIFLIQKISEETKELTESKSIEELADLYEVLEGIRDYLKISKDELTEVINNKRITNGSFSKGIILEKIEDKKIN